MLTTEEFEIKLAASIKTVQPRLEIGLDKVGELAATMAAHYLGTYQTGWAPLAESTIADKVHKGFPVPSPLLRMGEMRDSIKWEIEPIGLEVVIGSTDKKAVWHEHGTSRIPPRPFLGPALLHALPFAEETFGVIAIKILMEK